MKGRKQIWVDPCFEKFMKQHKRELRDILGGKKKKISDVEVSRFISSKYSFKVAK